MEIIKNEVMEKLANYGRSSITDKELLGLVLLGKTAPVDTLNQNSLTDLAKMTLDELKNIKGMTPRRAASIIAVFELGRRYRETPSVERPKITSSNIAYQILNTRLSDLPHEEFWVLFLNRANQVTGEMQLSKGGISGTVVDVRLICKAAIEKGASGIVIAHNHPSGQIIPSEQDKAITKKIKEALKFMEISLLDHIIIGDKKYLSFSDEGLM